MWLALLASCVAPPVEDLPDEGPRPGVPAPGPRIQIAGSASELGPLQVSAWGTPGAEEAGKCVWWRIDGGGRRLPLALLPHPCEEPAEAAWNDVRDTAIARLGDAWWVVDVSGPHELAALPDADLVLLDFGFTPDGSPLAVATDGDKTLTFSPQAGTWAPAAQRETPSLGERLTNLHPTVRGFEALPADPVTAQALDATAAELFPDQAPGPWALASLSGTRVAFGWRPAVQGGPPTASLPLLVEIEGGWAAPLPRYPGGPQGLTVEHRDDHLLVTDHGRHPRLIRLPDAKVIWLDDDLMGAARWPRKRVALE